MGHDGGPEGATSDETNWDAAALQEWVAHVADTEGTTEGEVLDRMLSSLWILDEVESLMEESDVRACEHLVRLSGWCHAAKPFPFAVGG